MVKNTSVKLALIPCSDINDGRRRAYDYIEKHGWVESLNDVDVIESFNDLSKTYLISTPVRVFQISSLAGLDNAKIVLNKLVSALNDNNSILVNSGLVIVSDISNSVSEMKKLSETVKKFGGYVDKNRSEQLDSILSELSLSYDVQQAVKSYVGFSVEGFISAAREIKKLPEQVQESLTWRDVKNRIPMPQGENAPWGVGFGKNAEPGLDELILQHRTREAVNKAMRVLDGSKNNNYFGMVSWLRNQFSTLFTMKELLIDKYSDVAIAEFLELPNPTFKGKGQKDPATKKSGYPTYAKIRLAESLSESRLLSMLSVVNNTLMMLKDGGIKCKLSPKTTIVRMVILLCN